MEDVEARAEYEKLAELLEELRQVCERNRMPDEVGAALEGNHGNAEALRNLRDNLRVKRGKVLSELLGITKAFG
jgi:hypothetical protein